MPARARPSIAHTANAAFRRSSNYAMSPDTRVETWPLRFIGRARPRGKRGQLCKRLNRGPGGVTSLVRFKSGGDHWVLTDKLVDARSGEPAP